MNPLVSVIVTCRNEEKNVENCLLSIRNQNYKNIEIIVVDDKSSDDTVEICRKYTKKIIISKKHLERSGVRNLGGYKAVGRYLFFLDADMILGKNVVFGAVKTMEKDSKLMGLYISEVILGNSFWQKCRRLERSFYDGTVIDGVRFIRKEAFNRIGGFDEKLIGPEDWDFDKRIRLEGKVNLLGNYDFGRLDRFLGHIDYEKYFVDKLIFADDLIIFHNEYNVNLAKYLAKKQYYAYNFSKYIGKWGASDIDVRRQFGLWYRYMMVFGENRVKLYRMLKHPILMLGIFIMRFLVGVIYLRSKILCNLYKQGISVKIRL